MELDFAGLAVAGLDGVDDAGADFGGDGEAVDEDEDGLGEVEFEEGFGGGEFDDLAGLIEAVVAAAAEFGEALFEGVGEGSEDRRTMRCFRGFFCSGFLCGFGWFGMTVGGGGLHGLEFDFGGDDGEEGVGAGAFGRARRAVTISSTVSWLTMPPQWRQVTVPQRA